MTPMLENEPNYKETSGHHRHAFLRLFCKRRLLKGLKLLMEKILSSANFDNFSR